MANPIIVVSGRRWFQKSYGNTYHSVTVRMPDESTHNSGIHYGYGSQYMQTAVTMIYKHLGEVEPERDASWKLRERFDIVESVADVARERDLK